MIADQELEREISMDISIYGNAFVHYSHDKPPRRIDPKDLLKEAESFQQLLGDGTCPFCRGAGMLELRISLQPRTRLPIRPAARSDYAMYECQRCAKKDRK